MLRQRIESRADALLALTTTAITLIVLSLPLALLWDVLVAGIPQLSFGFLFDSPTDAGRGGGIAPLIVSTLWILATCLAVALPIGLGCALFLSELVPVGSRLERYLSYSLDVLSGVPSIVFGLFGYRFFAIELGLGFSILSGGLSLACMILPLLIRTSEQAFRATPLRYRQASAALAISRFGFLWNILLPVAGPGVAVAIILSVGRALAETAVLLFTAGYVMRMPDSVLDSGRTLSVHIYDLAMNVPGGGGNAAATAVVLLSVLILINTAARRLGNYWHRMER